MQNNVKKPVEGEWFEVKPAHIDQKMFDQERSDWRQERTRRLIKAAFYQLEATPEYYQSFKTLIPSKDWNGKTVSELKEIANAKGDRMADWFEQALEWAQRIFNGETWEAVCNQPDDITHSRMIFEGKARIGLVGGKKGTKNATSATDYTTHGYIEKRKFFDAVPLIVSYS